MEDFINYINKSNIEDTKQLELLKTKYFPRKTIRSKSTPNEPKIRDFRIKNRPYSRKRFNSQTIQRKNFKLKNNEEKRDFKNFRDLKDFKERNIDIIDENKEKGFFIKRKKKMDKEVKKRGFKGKKSSTLDENTRKPPPLLPRRRVKTLENYSSFKKEDIMPQIQNFKKNGKNPYLKKKSKKLIFKQKNTNEELQLQNIQNFMKNVSIPFNIPNKPTQENQSFAPKEKTQFQRKFKKRSSKRKLNNVVILINGKIPQKKHPFIIKITGEDGIERKIEEFQKKDFEIFEGENRPIF